MLARAAAAAAKAAECDVYRNDEWTRFRVRTTTGHSCCLYVVRRCVCNGGDLLRITLRRRRLLILMITQSAPPTTNTFSNEGKTHRCGQDHQVFYITSCISMIRKRKYLPWDAIGYRPNNCIAITTALVTAMSGLRWNLLTLAFSLIDHWVIFIVLIIYFNLIPPFSLKPALPPVIIIVIT